MLCSIWLSPESRALLSRTRMEYLRQGLARAGDRGRRGHRPRDRANVRRARRAGAHLRRRRCGAERVACPPKISQHARRRGECSRTSSGCSTRSRQHLGGLDVLVNNAGIAGPTAKVEDIRPEDWDRCIAVDLNGMFYCTRKAMPLIKARGRRQHHQPVLHRRAPRLPACARRTAAAKWGVVGFTKSLAVEAGPRQGARQLHPARHRRGRAHRAHHRRQGRGARRILGGSSERMLEGTSLQHHRDARRTSPTWRCSSLPTPAATSPARRFPFAAARATWSRSARRPT